MSPSFEREHALNCACMHFFCLKANLGSPMNDPRLAWAATCAERSADRPRAPTSRLAIYHAAADTRRWGADGTKRDARVGDAREDRTRGIARTSLPLGGDREGAGLLAMAPIG